MPLHTTLHFSSTPSSCDGSGSLCLLVSRLPEMWALQCIVACTKTISNALVLYMHHRITTCENCNPQDQCSVLMVQHLHLINVTDIITPYSTECECILLFSAKLLKVFVPSLQIRTPLGV